MKIEFTYHEVIDFMQQYALFSMAVEERTQTLLELGEIDDENVSEAAKYNYNETIKNEMVFSRLIKNSFWEGKIKEITSNSIHIVDHNDEDISGECCKACGYIVFEDKEDAFYEICPVCGWQNDNTKGDEYSSCNHSSLNDYKASPEFAEKCRAGGDKYILGQEKF